MDPRVVLMTDAHPVRVLRIITRLNVGGPAAHVAMLTRRMSGRFETTVVTGSEGPGEGSALAVGRIRLPRPPVRVARLQRKVSPFDDLVAFVSLIRLMRRHKPDIVETHLAKAGALGRIAAAICGVPVRVHTFHGNVFAGYFTPTQGRFVVEVEKRLARITTRLIALTEGQRSELVRRGFPPGKIVVMRLGIEMDEFARRDRAESRRALGLSIQGELVGIVGRLTPIKDVPTFLRAVAELIRARPSVRALVSGDGEEADGLRSLARELGIEDRCSFIGWRTDLSTVYSALDVLALSSLSEGSPMSVLEAMAVGCPVVATRAGGVPDLISDGKDGLLVPPRDPSALAGAIARLLDDPGLARSLATSAHARVRAEHDPSRLARDAERLYEELVG